MFQYFSLVILMFLIEFILATLAFIYRDDLNYLLKEELRDGIRFHYRNETENGLETIWSRIHTKVSKLIPTMDYENKYCLTGMHTRG